jgi:hypothetical protein
MSPTTSSSSSALEVDWLDIELCSDPQVVRLRLRLRVRVRVKRVCDWGFWARVF